MRLLVEPHARGMTEVAEQLAALLSNAPAERPRLRALDVARAPAQVAAVDGSSVVLAESGSHVLGAFRTASVRAARASASPVEVCLLADRERGGLDELRAGSERTLARDLLATLGAGDLLLVDGSLYKMDDVAADAMARGVDLVGVCKSTSLTLAGAPALAACQLAARDARLVTWHAELAAPAHLPRGTRVLVARLSRAEDRPFRFDIMSAREEPAAVLARVAALAGHPAYPGYPSPLAMAHQAAVITEDERRRLAASVMDRVAERGVRGEAWRAAFLDYHDILELGV